MPKIQKITKMFFFTFFEHKIFSILFFRKTSTHDFAVKNKLVMAKKCKTEVGMLAFK